MGEHILYIRIVDSQGIFLGLDIEELVDEHRLQNLAAGFLVGSLTAHPHHLDLGLQLRKHNHIVADYSHGFIDKTVGIFLGTGRQQRQAKQHSRQ